MKIDGQQAKATQKAPRRGVRGGGEQTRQAILEAARELFGTRAYEQVGLRDIAAAAGATAALVNRYFGTKEQLFRAVLDSGKPVFFDRLLSDDRAQFGESVARLIVYGETASASPSADHATEHAPAPSNVSYVVHSLGSPVVADLIREVLDTEATPRLAEWLGGPDAQLRAEMVFACFTGVHAMRQVVGTSALRHASAEQLIAVLAPILQACVETREV